MKNIIFTVIFLLLFSPLPSIGQDDGGQAKPVSITADRMEADDVKQVVIFSGNVIAKQEDMILTCDVMRVYYTKTEKSASKEEQGISVGLAAGQNEIDRIEANGNFKITKDDQVAQSQKAVYLASARPRRIILTGEPRIWKNKDYLTGKRIIYYLDENRSVVEGGRKDRVNAVFYQSAPDKPKD